MSPERRAGRAWRGRIASQPGGARDHDATCNHLPVDLRLSLLEGTPIFRDHVGKPFTHHPGFADSWWIGDAKAPVVFCSFTTELFGEVARAQLRPNSDMGMAYPTYRRPPAGATEIDLFEVRTDLQGHGIGREAVARVLEEFPGICIALSLNKRSDGFWQSLGWSGHTHEDAEEYHTEGPGPALLFVCAT